MRKRRSQEGQCLTQGENVNGIGWNFSDSYPGLSDSEAGVDFTSASWHVCWVHSQEGYRSIEESAGRSNSDYSSSYRASEEPIAIAHIKQCLVEPQLDEAL